MTRYIFILWVIILSPIAFGCGTCKPVSNISLVPRPMQVVPGDGNFIFTDKTVFSVESAEQALIANSFIDLFTHAAGFTPKLNVGKKEGANIRFETDSSLKSEAYSLDVLQKTILIKASDIKGFFYALQTIRQLLPASIEEKNTFGSHMEWKIPVMSIRDEPRFEYRALLLDVSRFFIPKENVMRIIDCMGMLKINILHLHLTDDNGWRIEIKKYPRLTDIGAWRVDHMDVPFPSRRNPNPGEPTPIGGFYTQEDIKEMVAYATERQIEIVPEIDVPAHSNAALAAYPKLACPVVKDYIGVLPGLGGNNSDIIFCAGNDSVFTFLENVFDEVLALFPSRYIHIGGDEARKKYWKQCSLCQARMKRENLKDEEDLQGYFMKRISDYVCSKGREVIGWDELTNSSFLPKGIIILGWQGYGQAALKAAEKGHRFIMTPARVMYLIRYQGPQWFEPLTYFGNNTLQDVYDYEPIQKGWKPEYASLLMGVQASLWTEFCNRPEDVDYLVFPRLAALAEVTWTQPEKKDWASFLKAMDKYNAHLDKKGIVYARSMYNIQHKVIPERGMLKVLLECIRPDVEIRLTTNGQEPTSDSQLYTEPLIVKDVQGIKAATFADGRQMGKTLRLPIICNKATGKPVIGIQPIDNVLTNGVRGSLKQTDFEWFSNMKNGLVSFTIDLQRQEKISSCIIECITNYGMGVHKPKAIRVEVSDDNIIFHDVGGLGFAPSEIFQEGTFIEDITVKMKQTCARYVRVTAEGAGCCPPNHVRPGQESRVCFDEVIIE
ncbi:beta-N-acetylhexosaminidase [Porphyromonas pogonae]|uniref:beta-N-acetylhexosaminidase n=1 Tax=Porphyromonas pogonae TaxID=867595 RepID=UPI002E772005|nr:family 20 glycosylhydrolase [Porphyromonas pogonae]